MNAFLQRTKNNVILMALITLILGLVLIIFPDAATLTLCLVLGWILVVSGVVSVIFFIAARERASRKLLLITGILELALGLWIVIAPTFWVRFIFIIFGLLLLFHGFGDFSDTLEMKRCGYERWWISLILAILTVALGILVILAPFTTAATMVVICGIALVFDALSDLFIILRVSNVVKKYGE